MGTGETVIVRTANFGHGHTDGMIGRIKIGLAKSHA